MLRKRQRNCVGTGFINMAVAEARERHTLAGGESGGRRLGGGVISPAWIICKPPPSLDYDY
jgi:hypothetical protein